MSRFVTLFQKLLSDRNKSAHYETVYITAPPEPVVENFPLRKTQEDELYKALCQRGRQILLYGPGGMGKTHMARKLFYRLRGEYKRMAWVSYGSGIRESMTMPQTENASDNSDIRFADFIRALEEEPDTILFIDDAKETAVDDLVLGQLTGLGITILLTSRCPAISPYESWNIVEVTNQECVDLFYAHYPKDPEQKYRSAVQTIADRLERNIFAIRLLAAVAGESTELPRMMEVLEKGSLMEHIGQFMNFSGITDSQRDILCCLSLMPESEMPIGLVSWFEFSTSELETLIEKGWLTQNTETESLVLHDLVREYCNREEPSRYTVDTFIKGVLGENFESGAAPYISATLKGKILELQMRAVYLMERFWDSPEDLAKAYNTIGTEFRGFGSYRNALEYLLKSLKLREEVLPSDHPDLAASYNNVGIMYDCLGDYEKALEYQLKDLAICEKTLPSDHPNLATSYNNVGTLYSELGDYEKALEYQLKDLAICEKMLSSNHPDLATSYNNVGTLYGQLGDYKKAVEYQLKDIAICEKMLSSNHPDLATSYNNVGALYSELGDYEKALEYQLKGLTIREKVFSSDHPDLARSYNNIGITYCCLADYKKALEYQLKALVIREKVLPSDHPNLATSYNNVGATYGHLGDCKRALEYQLKDLAICEKVLPSDHPNLATSYNNVGAIYGKLGDYKKALEYQLKGLIIREKVLPEDHPDLATSYNNVGMTCDDSGDYEKALEYKLKGLAICEKVLPPHHPDIAKFCSSIAKSYVEMKQYEVALKWAYRALDIARHTLTADHPTRKYYQEFVEYLEQKNQN